MWACEFWWMCPEKIYTGIFQGILIFIFDFTDQYHLFTNTDIYHWHQISPTSGERQRFSIATVLHQHFTARGSSSYAPVRAPPFTLAPHPTPRPAMRSENQEMSLSKVSNNWIFLTFSYILRRMLRRVILFRFPTIAKAQLVVRHLSSWAFVTCRIPRGRPSFPLIIPFVPILFRCS